MTMLVFAWANPTYSGTPTSHLQPEEGYYGFQMFNPYYEAVSERLLSSSSYRKCQAVFLPSFTPESAVYIEYISEDPNTPPVVVSLQLEEQLWYEMQKLMESQNKGKRFNPADKQVQRKVFSQINSIINRSEAPIETEVAIKLEEAWDTMLLHTHYHTETGRGLDGVNYHFANFVKEYGYRTGKVWSPEKGTASYQLVELAKALQKYPTLDKESRDSAIKDMMNRAQQLTVLLKSNE